MSLEPPPLAERLMRWSLAPEERPAVLGDLSEEFEEQHQSAGDRAARWWYWRQTFTSVVPNVVRRIRNDENKRFQRGFVLFLIWTPQICARTWEAWHSVPVVLLALVGVAAFVLFSPVLFPRPRQAQLRVLRPLLVVFIGALLLRGLYPAPALVAFESTYLLAPLGIVIFVLALWRRWPPDPPPTEFFVRPRAAADRDPRTLLTLTVPNQPLAMSGLVVSRAVGQTNAVVRPGPLYLEPTIDRMFDRRSTLRIYAAVRTSDAPARLTCDVLDDMGRTVRSFTPPVEFDDFERLAKPWDVKPAEDPAPHVGRIDLTLPLADLAPGSYRIRVTTTDGTHAAQQEERITVRGT